MSSDSQRLSCTAEHDLMDERRQHAQTRRQFADESEAHRDTNKRLRSITTSVWYRLGKVLRLCP